MKMKESYLLFVFLLNKNIAEKGTHEELIQLENGHYRALCDAQYRFLLEE